tara:strand:- start:803 stop:3730 length:2928 start_codon:yes stop_codon:yes gene_type:complete
VDEESVNEGLLVLWNMNETTGLKLADASGNGHDGICSADQSIFWVDGKAGGGLDFTPKSYVSVSGLPETLSTTWSVWVNLQSKPSYGTAIAAGFPGAGAGHSLGFHTGDTAFHPRVLWNHALGHTSLLSPDPVNLNEWVHLATTYNGETKDLILYVNGEEKAVGTAESTPFASINLGQRESSKNAWIDAILDDARIYAKVLEPSEITALYGRRTTGPPEFTSNPQSQAVFSGEDVVVIFRAAADGLEPINFQWFKDGKEIEGEEYATLELLEGITGDNAGVYHVVATNGQGSSTSNEVTLNVTVLSDKVYGLVAQYDFEETGGMVANDSSGNEVHGKLMDFPDGDAHWVEGAFGVGNGLRIENKQFVELFLPKAMTTVSYTAWVKPESSLGNVTANWTEGIIDGGIKLEGPSAEEYVAVRNLPAITSTTWAAWVRLDEEVDYSCAISATFPDAAAGHTLGFWNGGNVRKPRVLWNHGPGHTMLASPDPVELGVWNHLAVTLDADTGTLVLYVNGVEKGRSTTAKTTAFTTLNLGRREGVRHRTWYDGAIDHVAVYNRALSLEEIALLVNKSSVDEGLVLLWEMDETTGAELADSSGNGHDGTWMTKNPQTLIGADFIGAESGHIVGFQTGSTPAHPSFLWNHGGTSSAYTHSSPAEIDEWVHMAMTLDWESKELIFYVDGDIATTTTSETTPFALVNIGRSVPTQNDWFTGVVDNIRIYDEVLSAADIVAQAKRPPEILEILSLSLAGEDQLDLVLKSPMPEREHVIQRKANLSDETWVDLSDVNFSKPGGNMITATFNRSADPISFYRAGILPQETIFFEDFESGAEGWEHGGTEDNWGLGTPVNGPGGAYSGENAYATGLDSDYAPGTDSFLVSPEIDLTGVNVATLVFQEFRDLDQNPLFHNVVVNILDSDTLEVIEELSRRAGSTSQWKEVSFPLGQDSLNRKIRLEFRLSSDNFNPRQGWYLDDISLLPE